MPGAAVFRAKGSPQRQAPIRAAVPAVGGRGKEEVSPMLGGGRGGLSAQRLLITSSNVLRRDPARGDQSSQGHDPPLLRRDPFLPLSLSL